MTGSHSPSPRYAAFFDLDGTLAVDNAPPSPADRDAIRAFRSRGNAVFLCTGRAPAHLYPAILDIGFDGIVAGAGAHITLGGQTIFRRFLSEQTIRQVADVSARTGYVCVLEGETGMFQVSLGDTRLPWPKVESGEDFLTRYPGEDYQTDLFPPARRRVGGMSFGSPRDPASRLRRSRPGRLLQIGWNAAGSRGVGDSA